MAREELAQHDLWTITFFSPGGHTRDYKDCVLMGQSDGCIQFLDKEERIIILSGGSYIAEQNEAVPEQSPIKIASPAVLSMSGRK